MNNETKKTSKNRIKKEKVVEELTEKVEKSKVLVFANYQGMTHKQLESLKKGMKAMNAEMIVAKNTLLKLSLEISNVKSQMSNLQGPTITLFAYGDVIAPLKELAKSIKSLKLPTIKFAILDSKILSEAEVLKLSTLPPREVLLAQLVYGLKSPLYGLHRALQWNLNKLVLTLKAIETKKSV